MIGLLRHHRVLICDRDRKWSREVRRLLGDAGIDVVLTPVRAPNANAYAERFVRSIKEECLDRMIPIGERHFRRAVREFVDALSSRAESSRAARIALIAGAPAIGSGRPRASTTASGRAAQLLRARGVISRLGRALGQYGHTLECSSAGAFGSRPTWTSCKVNNSSPPTTSSAGLLKKS